MNLLIYLSSYVIIILSLLGYGLFFQKILRNSVDIEFEYNFLGSLFFLTFLSYLTHFFFKHGFIHNKIIHKYSIQDMSYLLEYLLLFKELDN